MMYLALATIIATMSLLAIDKPYAEVINLHQTRH